MAGVQRSFENRVEVQKRRLFSARVTNSEHNNLEQTVPNKAEA